MYVLSTLTATTPLVCYQKLMFVLMVELNINEF